MHHAVPSVFRKYFAGLIFVATITASHAADLFWTNTAGGLWTTATNWSPNQVPTNSDVAWLTNAGT